MESRSKRRDKSSGETAAYGETKMAKNYTIQFMSLRAGTTYVVSIGGGTGSPVALKGGAEPFVTQEDDGEDVFQAVRTQTGYIRILDDGKDASGAVIDATLGANWWTDLVPANGTARPVTVTAYPTANAAGTMVWQGYIQAQSFSGELYGGTQEREFPVQCVLSALEGINVPTGSTYTATVKNFAFLLNTLFTQLSGTLFDYINVQGGSSALTMLQKKLDWQNFLTDETGSGSVHSKYNCLVALTDALTFWGWTARTKGRELFLTCADDSTMTKCLRITMAELGTIASGGSISTTYADMFTTVELAENYVNTDNDEIYVRGQGKATVSVDVNEHDEVLKFAPDAVRKVLENNATWTWVPGSSDSSEYMVGYFETRPTKTSFNTEIMSGVGTSGWGEFSRRMLYGSVEVEESTDLDIIAVKRLYTGSVMASLTLNRPHSYAGGSLRLSGQIYRGAKLKVDGDGQSNMRIRVGIGESHETARWFYLRYGTGTNISYGWTQAGTIDDFRVHAGAGNTYFAPLLYRIHEVWHDIDDRSFPCIPVPNEAGLSGKLFVDFLGCDDHGIADDFEIANFTVEFLRDQTYIPASTDEAPRGRTMKETRKTSREYRASNNQFAEEWNVDCIWASDNNMKYGYGLLMEADGTFMGRLWYGGSQEWPEQHLANRVSAFGNRTHRLLNVQTDVSQQEVGVRNKVTLGGKTYWPLAISREWHDDIQMITMIEM